MKMTATQKKRTARWTRSKADEMAVANGCWFDTEAARRACLFLTTFAREGGQPLTLSKWQAEEIIEPLFGWKRPDGRRRYEYAYLEAPEHASLAALASWLQLYLRAEGETQPLTLMTAGPCLVTERLYKAERARALSIHAGTVQDDTHFAYVRLETLP
jgi:hypothetical protein